MNTDIWLLIGGCLIFGFAFSLCKEIFYMYYPLCKRMLKRLKEGDAPKDDTFSKEEFAMNIFSAKGIEYHSQLKAVSNSIFRATKVIRIVTSVLDSFSLKDNFYLGVHIARHRGAGDMSYFYVYGKEYGEGKNILKYFHANETSMGAWQVYLLMTSSAILPTWWHGNYIARKFIFQKADLLDIKELGTLNLSDLEERNLLYPSVEVVQTSDGIVAYVYCCYWSEWKGLVREYIKIQICSKRIVSYECIDNIVLYEYNCGIMF